MSALVPGSEVQEERRKVCIALLALCMITLGGTVGFAEIEGWGLWRSLYFTLITITTVGYGDEGLSEDGRKFAIVLLIGGVVAASYAFATLLQASITYRLEWRMRMQKRIDRMHGHTIVCGFGRMGLAICERLTALESPFVVIERNPAEHLRAVERGFLAIEGLATEDPVLLRAGLERASHVVGAVDSMAENLVITMSSKEIRPEAVVIARAESDDDARKLVRAGADRIISPFTSGGTEIVNLITKPQLADFVTRAVLGSDDVTLAEVTVAEGSSIAGQTLGEYGRRAGTRISFVAISRPGEELRIPPRGSDLIMPGDHLIVAGDSGQIRAMAEGARSASAA